MLGLIKYRNIVPGLHKKLDVASMLIEDIIVNVTNGSRRNAFIEAVGGFEANITETKGEILRRQFKD